MYWWNDRLAEAVPLYHAYLEERDDDVVARHELGRVYNSLGRHDRAVRVLQQAVERRPGDPEIQLDLVRATVWKGAVAEGKQMLQLLLETFPDVVAAHELLADLYHARQDFLQAYAHYQEVLRLEPGHAGALWRTGEYRRRRKVDMARYKQMLKDDPDQPEIRRTLIEIWVAQERYSDALQAMDDHLSTQSGDEEIAALRRALREEQQARLASQLSVIQTHRADERDARIRMAQRWLAYQPQDHRSRYRLAALLMDTGRLGEARHEYEQLRQDGHRVPGWHGTGSTVSAGDEEVR